MIPEIITFTYFAKLTRILIKYSCVTNVLVCMCVLAERMMNNSTYAPTWSVGTTLWLVYSPVLLVVGLSGNLFALLVGLGSRLRHVVPTRYLVAIAAADTGALVFGLLPTWLRHAFNYDVVAAGGDVVCKFRDAIRYTSQDASIWLVCSFTFDRLVAVQWPLKRNRLRPETLATTSVCVVVTLAVVKNVHIMWTRSWMGGETGNTSVAAINVTALLLAGVDTRRCVARPEYDYFETQIRPWLVLLTANVIPFAFLVACNTAIIRRLVGARTARRSLLHQMNPHVGRRLKGAAEPDCGGHIGRLTSTCLAVSITFLVLVSPSIVLLAVRSFRTDSDRLELAWAATSLLNYTNNAVNFYLYCLTGSRFRAEVRRITTCRSYSHQYDASATRRRLQLMATASVETCASPFERRRRTTQRQQCYESHRV